MKYIFVLLFLSGCVEVKKGTIENVTGSKDDFQVSFLFKKDKCSVYRFIDAEHYHYFTDCAETMTDYNRNCGKGCVEHFRENIGKK